MRKLLPAAAWALAAFIAATCLHAPSASASWSLISKACALSDGGGGGSCPAPSACTGPLDVNGTGAKFAGGLRLLSGAYAGKAALLERASDSTTSDIGFVGCNFDTTTAATFCAATTCTVKTLHCQIASCPWTAEPTNATLANQPLYVASCVNSQPCMKGNGTTQYLAVTTGDASETNLTVIMLAAVVANGSGNGRFFETDTGAGGNSDYITGFVDFINNGSSNQLGAGGTVKNGSTVLTPSTAPPTVGTFAVKSTWATTAASGTYGVDLNRGTATASNGSSPSVATATAHAQLFAGYQGSVSAWCSCEIEEVIVYAADYSAAGSRNPIEGNICTFAGISC